MSLKEDLINELESTRREYHLLVESVPEATYRSPSANPVWSIGDVLYHITLGPPAVRVEIWIILHAGWLFENAKLGELVLTGLREAPRGDVKIDVTFSMNTDGMLDVTAVDRQTQQKQACTLNIAGGLSAEEIARLKLASLDPSGAIVSVDDDGVRARSLPIG